MPNGGSSSQPAAAMGESGAAPVAKVSGPDPLIGRVINDRFKVTALIARGGMGKVYRAEQAPLGRVCAVKVLNPNYSGEHDPEFHKRFFLEASISSKLTHPNTVTIFDYGRTDDNIYFMAMEYLEGRTLHRTLREEGPFIEERTTHIARQVCRSLREAHSLGVIHRDLKPANVFLIEHGDETDFVKVLDFGLVKNIEEGKGEDLTQTGLFMGSPKYMAPEQIRGEHVDARTDIYSLGIIIYEMITGKVPFDRPNSVNILMAHVNERVPALKEMNPNANVSDVFERLLFKCLEKNPDDRYKSMDELLGALKMTSGHALTGTISAGSADRSGSFDLLGASGSFTPQPTPQLGTGSVSGSGQVAVLSPDPGSGSGSGNIFGTTTTGAPLTAPKKAGKAPLIIGGGVAVAAIIGILVFMSSKGGDKDAKPGANDNKPALTAPSTPASTAATASTTAAPSATAVVEEAKLKIETDPAGAQVKEDDSPVCEKTPCEVTVTEKPRKLTLTLKDHASETITVKKGDTPHVTKLGKKAVWVPPTKKDDKDKPPTGPSKDFKDSPY